MIQDYSLHVADDCLQLLMTENVSCRTVAFPSTTMAFTAAVDSVLLCGMFALQVNSLGLLPLGW